MAREAPQKRFQPCNDVIPGVSPRGVYRVGPETRCEDYWATDPWLGYSFMRRSVYTLREVYSGRLPSCLGGSRKVEDTFSFISGGGRCGTVWTYPVKSMHM